MIESTGPCSCVTLKREIHKVENRIVQYSFNNVSVLMNVTVYQRQIPSESPKKSSKVDVKAQTECHAMPKVENRLSTIEL